MSEQPELPELSLPAVEDSEVAKDHPVAKYRSASNAHQADKYAQLDFFAADFYDVSVKDDRHTMEHPFFSLKTQKDTAIRHYTHKGIEITVTPSVAGIATIWDKDLLIFATSQLVEGINRQRGDIRNRKVRFSAYSYLLATGKQTGGKDYAAILKSLSRLKGTVIETNIQVGGKILRKGFGLIEDWETVEDANGSGMGSIEITLSAWLFEAVQALEVLTINRAYFKIRGGVEKRLYEIARKHCGRQATWSIGEEELFKKTGSTGSIRDFRRILREVVKTDSLPDYRVRYDENLRKVTFYTKNMKALGMEALEKIVAAA
ncbi:replication initiator protein A [Paraburkholderia sp. A1RI-2L]|uniref:replication initiator protein A n=1 Tax=Paraburkholderia sp. A1RI-2L TaxID=3028367 RepID=UPI003B7F752B